MSPSKGKTTQSQKTSLHRKPKQTKESLKFFSHFMLLLDQFKSELTCYVCLLSNYSVIELTFSEEPLPCQNKNWGYNFSNTFKVNEYKCFHYIFFVLPTFRFLLGIPTVFTTRKSGGEEKPRRHCSHRCTDLGQSFVSSLYANKYCYCTSRSGSVKSRLFSSLFALTPSVFFPLGQNKKVIFK